jgi:uncharacterized protein (DUF1499 family)
MIMGWLAFFDGLVAVALAMAGVVAAHYGLTTPILGFALFAGGLLFAVLALIFCLIAMITMMVSPARRAALPRAVTGGALSLALVLPVVLLVITHPYPAINDITTDTKNPPEFVHAQEQAANQGRDLKYDAATYAAIQEATPAYKDLAPLKMEGSPDEVFKKAEIIVGEVPTWQITGSDPQTRQIEGIATSSLFRFKDDFVIQVRAAESGGSLIEMRSKSRDGKGDFGANYNRIQSFFRLIQGQPRGVTPPQTAS